SAGFMSLILDCWATPPKEAPTVELYAGTPSITNKGSLSPVIVLAPRITILDAAPGAPDVPVILTPAAFADKPETTFVSRDLVIASPDTRDEEVPCSSSSTSKPSALTEISPISKISG